MNRAIKRSGEARVACVDPSNTVRLDRVLAAESTLRYRLIGSGSRAGLRSFEDAIEEGVGRWEFEAHGGCKGVRLFDSLIRDGTQVVVKDRAPAFAHFLQHVAPALNRDQVQLDMEARRIADAEAAELGRRFGISFRSGFVPRAELDAGIQLPYTADKVVVLAPSPLNYTPVFGAIGAKPTSAYVVQLSDPAEIVQQVLTLVTPPPTGFGMGTVLMAGRTYTEAKQMEDVLKPELRRQLAPLDISPELVEAFDGR